MKRSNTFSLALAGALVLLLVAIGAALAGLPPGGTFNDDNGNVHEGNIEAIAAEGITRGCNPPTNNLYCPSSNLTRGQMAAFIRRALSLPSSSTDYFVDDNDSIFEGDINALAEAGITRGCNPPTSDRFCPDGTTTREQMAAFLRRAFNYPAATTDYFTDDDTSIFEADINAIAKAGVTLGCNPPTNDLYCPKDLVKRDQMASFFARALGLTPITPPPPTTSTTMTATTLPPTTPTTSSTTTTTTALPTTTTSLATTTWNVSIVNFRFDPPSVPINVGDTVQWTLDEGTHTVSITPGGVFSRTFDQAGIYPYFCTIHPSIMKGTITVNG